MKGELSMSAINIGADVRGKLKNVGGCTTKVLGVFGVMMFLPLLGNKASAASNLLSNGDFESWNGAFPNSWTGYAYSQSFVQSNAYKYRGNTSLLLHSNPDNFATNGTPALTQNFTIPAGHKCINVRFYYWGDGSPLAIRIREQGNTTTVKYYNGTDWSNYVTVNANARTGYFQDDSGVASDKYSWRWNSYNFWQKIVLQIPVNGSQTQYAIDLMGDNQTSTSKAVYIDDVCVTSTPEQRTVLMQAVSWYAPSSTTDSSTDSRGVIWDKSTLSDTYAEHVNSLKILGVDVLSVSCSIRNSANGNPTINNPLNQTYVINDWLTAVNANTRPGKLKIVCCIDNFPANNTTNTANAIKYMIDLWKNNDAYWRDSYGNVMFTTYAINSQNDNVANDPAYTKLNAAYWTDVKSKLTSMGVTNFVMIGDCYENPYKAGGATAASQGIDGNSIRSIANCGMFTGGLSATAINHNLSWMQYSWVPSGTRDTMEYICNYGVGTFWMPGVTNGYYRYGGAFIEPTFNYLNWCWSNARAAATNNSTYNRRVNLYTWNDLNEDTTCWPGQLKGYGLYNLQQFYLDWYKMDNAIATNDQIVINYCSTNSGAIGTTGGEGRVFDVNYWGNFNADNTKLELKDASGLLLGSVMVSGTGIQFGSFVSTKAKLTNLSQIVVSRGGTTLYTKSLTASYNSGVEGLRYRYVWVNP
jgi:hypothetical protein